MRTSRVFSILLVLVVAALTPAQASAQPDRFQSKATFGLAYGLWDRVPTPATDHRSGWSMNQVVEFRIGQQRPDGWRLSLRSAMGRGDGASQPGFNLVRWVFGTLRPITSASSGAFTVYAGAGVGPVVTREDHQRVTRFSAAGSLGVDGALGRSPFSIATEFELHSMGTRLLGTATVGVRLHLR